MGIFRNPEVRAARQALDEQHETERVALRAGDPEATARNLALQDELRAAEQRATGGR